MKQLAVIVAICLLSSRMLGQGNLVPNCSFENHTSCPTNSSQIDRVVGWKAPTLGTPDYFNSCGGPGFSVPDNALGSQNAHTGNGYVGIVVYADGYTEYIQAELSDTLKAGKSYCVEYYVSLAGWSRYGSIGPQCYFSPDSIRNTTNSNFNYVPQIAAQGIISDTTNWVLISGDFVASGNERYITIGNFHDSLSTPYDTVNSSVYSYMFSYFYIDNIAVVQKVNADAGNDMTICLGDSVQLGSLSESGITYRWNSLIGLNDSTISQPWAKPTQTSTYILAISDTGALYCTGNTTDTVTVLVHDCTVPAAFFIPTLLYSGQTFFIPSLPVGSKLQIFDSRGRIVFNTDNYLNDFTPINLDTAVYFVELTKPDGEIVKQKLCVVK